VQNTGYSGRVAIIEIMTITDEIRKLVIKRSGSMDISKVAIEQACEL
jgi:type IV pilus assembly protein PilB